MRLGPVLAAAVAVAAGMGCWQAEVAPAPDQSLAATGTSAALTVEWTVDGASDPSACDRGGAAAIEIVVVNAAGQPVGTFQQSCAAFSTSLDLETGIYSGTARLLDAAGNPRTRNVAIEEVTLLDNSQLSVPLAFSTATAL